MPSETTTVNPTVGSSVFGSVATLISKAPPTPAKIIGSITGGPITPDSPTFTVQSSITPAPDAQGKYWAKMPTSRFAPVEPPTPPDKPTRISPLLSKKSPASPVKSRTAPELTVNPAPVPPGGMSQWITFAAFCFSGSNQFCCIDLVLSSMACRIATFASVYLLQSSSVQDRLPETGPGLTTEISLSIRSLSFGGRPCTLVNSCTQAVPRGSCPVGSVYLSGLPRA